MKKDEKDIVITSAVRTAIGTFQGSLKDMQAHDLGALVVKEVMKRSNLSANDIDELIMGQVLTSAVGQNPARQAAIKANIPSEKTAYVINQVCGSGLRSVAAGYQSILSGDSNIIIAGGQESMSNAPHYIKLLKGEKIGPQLEKLAKRLAAQGAKPLNYNHFKVPLMGNLAARAVRALA